MIFSRRAIAALGIAAASAAALAIAQEIPTISDDGAELAVHAPAMPIAPLTIETAGEYQIEATTTAGDVQLFLLQGDVIAAEDTTSLGSDARIVAFLEAGDYGVRVRDALGRAITAALAATHLPPLPVAATIAPGDPAVTVTVPHGGSSREGSAEVTLTIASAGTYQIDVTSPDVDHDAEMHLIREGVLLQSDADGGEGTDARIVRALEPGDYTIRVHDYANRGGALAVSAVLP